ncbi:hypothetical protein [Deinococcus altitudinis]|uniref:hypothetical protein n=1 Tax=Deinococcus altitudinis TaxID=468914 RepID=UPI00389126C2
MSVPPRLQPASFRSARRGRPPRFDKARATLALLLLSAAVFAFSALEHVRAQPGQPAHASIWNDRSPERPRTSAEWPQTSAERQR